jgi:hypothetical protein
MKVWTLVAGMGIASTPLALFGGCGGDDNTGPPKLDAGNPDTTTDGPSQGDSSGDSPTMGDGPAPDGGFTLMMAPPPPPLNTLKPGQLLLTASGESLALSGYSFPAVNAGDPVFADGWEVHFDHFIATYDKVSMWSNPDMVPTDQSQHGALVAELDGPFAVDLHQNGASYPYIDGKEQGERAVAFAGRRASPSTSTWSTTAASRSKSGRPRTRAIRGSATA